MQRISLNTGLVLLLPFFFVPFLVSAQTTGIIPSFSPQAIRANAIENYLEIQITPPNPGPDQEVSITIQSYLADLNKSTILWILDDEILAEGMGIRTATFKNAPAGGSRVLKIVLFTNNNEQAVRTLHFNPVGVTLMWEADTYTPPFYKGKPLLSPQANLRVIATPDISSINPNTLSYTWKRDGAIVRDASGVGKNTFTLSASRPFDNLETTLSVSSLDNTISSETRVSVPVVTPYILLYEDHPLLGVWYKRPLGSAVDITERELSLVAEPYYFSNETTDTVFDYVWRLNGSPLNAFGRMITLRNEEGLVGLSDISLTIESFEKIFQAAERSLRINFTETPSGSRTIF